jgi:hypothetical protein
MNATDPLKRRFNFIAAWRDRLLGYRHSVSPEELNRFTSLIKKTDISDVYRTVCEKTLEAFRGQVENDSGILPLSLRWKAMDEKDKTAVLQTYADRLAELQSSCGIAVNSGTVEWFLAKDEFSTGKLVPSADDKYAIALNSYVPAGNCGSLANALDELTRCQFKIFNTTLARATRVGTLEQSDPLYADACHFQMLEDSKAYIDKRIYDAYKVQPAERYPLAFGEAVSKGVRAAEDIFRTAKMENCIARAQSLLEEAVDPEYGAIGREITQALRFYNCIEMAVSPNDSQGVASYRPFTWLNNYPTTDEKTGKVKFVDYKAGDDLSQFKSFMNIITYKVDDLDEDDLVFSRFHEGLHAIQWNSTPAAHTCPRNMKAVVMACPRDHALMVQLTEQDVYAKQGWLASLLIANHPELKDKTKYSPVGPDEFKKLRQESANLPAALSEAAKLAMTKKVTGGATFLDYYHNLALDDYMNMIESYKRAGYKPVFVRLAPEDLKQAGQSVGPNFIKDDPAFMTLELSEANTAKLALVNAKLGLTGDENELPTFQHALQDKGMTPGDFMEYSRERRSAVPVEKNTFLPVPAAVA